MSFTNARATAEGVLAACGSWRRHRSLILATPSRRIAQVSLRCPMVLDVRALGRARAPQDRLPVRRVGPCLLVRVAPFGWRPI